MKQLSLLAASLLFSVGAFAAAADHVTVENPYVRLAPPSAPTTGAFMVIRNGGDKDIKVLKAENPVSNVTELHTHLNENGVMKMRQVPSIDIKSGGEAKLQPGGPHVMLIDLKAPLKEGDVVPITLSFDDGSSKKIEAKVQKVAPAMTMEHKHPM